MSSRGPKTFLDVLEQVQRGEAVLTRPVLVEVAEIGAMPAMAHDAGDSVTMFTQAGWSSERWASQYAREYGNNVCHILNTLRPVTIGRSRSCSLRILDGSVSSLHARLYFDRGDCEYYVVDEDSRNGTFLNGERLTPGENTRLYSGAMLWFGKTAFVFLLSSTVRKLASLADDK
ncbi:FHA domain-containing protein [Haliangium ochraceum]|uniref:FHA domain containing protein n=1 Tax=Haliangium ochraceum (strain DSM 14365 / JCM 11303 / SMP-2) TaxID=502025 RepID=D0LRH0_HALO1|nr:FHA domain-containing protein [Haliangium ochraceum]ACY17198.1 FHA domain containing protein [Haliangium ochraceum DSM 14365]